jgi:hypothetical protein
MISSLQYRSKETCCKIVDFGTAKTFVKGLLGEGREREEEGGGGRMEEAEEEGEGEEAEKAEEGEEDDGQVNRQPYLEKGGNREGGRRGRRGVEGF